jgi:glutamate dehydrogenase/leucine dehydrogenase
MEIFVKTIIGLNMALDVESMTTNKITPTSVLTGKGLSWWGRGHNQVAQAS